MGGDYLLIIMRMGSDALGPGIAQAQYAPFGLKSVKDTRATSTIHVDRMEPARGILAEGLCSRRLV